MIFFSAWRFPRKPPPCFSTILTYCVCARTADQRDQKGFLFGNTRPGPCACHVPSECPPEWARFYLILLLFPLATLTSCKQTNKRLVLHNEGEGKKSLARADMNLSKATEVYHEIRHHCRHHFIAVIKSSPSSNLRYCFKKDLEWKGFVGRNIAPHFNPLSASFPLSCK